MESSRFVSGIEVVSFLVESANTIPSVFYVRCLGRGAIDAQARFVVFQFWFGDGDGDGERRGGGESRVLEYLRRAGASKAERRDGREVSLWEKWLGERDGG